jgi:large subunit ribosomal protein L11
MAKEISGFIKLQVKGGAANPSPPIGPALGAKGVNIMDFCKQFNGAHSGFSGEGIAGGDHGIRTDKSFEFVIKKPPVAVSIKEAIKLKSGSAEPNRAKVGVLSVAQIKAIAEEKLPDMNCFTIESAMHNDRRYCARSMGVTVKGQLPAKV